ncbi:MAG: helicase, partial [Fibrobacteraceae bacterium]
MSNFKIGQRFVSEQEPELGIGRISAVAFRNVTIQFPAVGETRIYRDTGAALKRYLLKAGESAKSEKGASVLIESVRMEDGLAVYCGRGGREIREQDLQPKAVARSSEIFEALASGRTSDNVEFLRRERANVLSCEWQVSP